MSRRKNTPQNHVEGRLTERSLLLLRLMDTFLFNIANFSGKTFVNPSTSTCKLHSFIPPPVPSAPSIFLAIHPPTCPPTYILTSVFLAISPPVIPTTSRHLSYTYPPIFHPGYIPYLSFQESQLHLLYPPVSSTSLHLSFRLHSSICPPIYTPQPVQRATPFHLSSQLHPSTWSNSPPCSIFPPFLLAASFPNHFLSPGYLPQPLPPIYSFLQMRNGCVVK